MPAPSFRHVVVGPFVQNAYLLSCPETKEGVLVDAGWEPEEQLEMIREEGVTLKAVIATHGHIDHVWGATTVCAALNVPFLMHADDLFWLDGLDAQARLFGLEPPPGRPESKASLRDGEIIEFGSVRLRVIHTPGHTPGSVCLHDGDGNLWTGDTLFQGSVGRTDLPGGNFDTLAHSIRAALFTLPAGTVVHPGHGPSTRIDLERRSNPFVGEDAGGNPFRVLR